MRRRPGEVRDAIVQVLEARQQGASVSEIAAEVEQLIGDVPASSIRSYLQLNTPTLFDGLSNREIKSMKRGTSRSVKRATEKIPKAGTSSRSGFCNGSGITSDPSSACFDC